jgi:hypothetical protein
VAAPFFRAGDPFEETNENTLTEMAYAKWIDPVLGVLAFHAHDHVLSTHSRPFNEDNRWMLRNMIRSNLSKFFAEVPDSRIVAALDRDLVVRRGMFLDLLKDDGLGQPVLTASLARLAAAAVAERWNDHWSVERFDRVTPGSVFNVVHTAGDNDDGESL